MRPRAGLVNHARLTILADFLAAKSLIKSTGLCRPTSPLSASTWGAGGWTSASASASACGPVAAGQLITSPQTDAAVNVTCDNYRSSDMHTSDAHPRPAPATGKSSRRRRRRPKTNVTEPAPSKRRRSAYVFFVAEQRSKLTGTVELSKVSGDRVVCSRARRASFQLLDPWFVCVRPQPFGDIARAIGRRWRSMSVEQRAVSNIDCSKSLFACKCMCMYAKRAL